MIALYINSGGDLFVPDVEDGVTVDLERRGTPGKLTFQVAPGGTYAFFEGDVVILSVDGESVFRGYVFEKSRSKNGAIQVTAYDQLRYLKNKDTIAYDNITASDLLKRLCDDFQLQYGAVADTEWVIEDRVEDNQTLFDIIETALDITLRNTGRLFVLRDDNGLLTLTDIADMGMDVVIDEEAGEDYDYQSSIDDETYNQIKLAYENDKTKKRDIYIVKDSESIARWGLLQYFETIDENTSGSMKAETLLRLYNRKTRNLTVKGVRGDVRMVAGSRPWVNLELGDVTVQSRMLVEKVKHSYEAENHTMDLTLRGGEFVV